MAMSRPNLPSLLKGYLLLGTILLIGFGAIYTTKQISRLNKQSRVVANLFARFTAMAIFPSLNNPEVKEIFEEVVKPADFPMILADPDGRPFVWKLPDVPDTIDIQAIASIDPDNPPPGPLREVIQLRDRFRRENKPIPILRPGDSAPFGYVYYGEAGLVREMKWIPLIQVAAVVLFIGIGYIGYRSIKTSEQRAIWIGLAKETAHQLGTPISSLLGWVELMRERQLESDQEEETITLDRTFFTEVLDEMENDSERLQKVANRFGQVGSTPRLEMEDVAPIVSESVRYFRRRIPHLGKDVEIRERYDLAPPVSINKELIEWVVENVLKNALDATDRAKGVIDVEVVRRKTTESVEIRITDQGKGMTAKEMKMIFSPGFTTKQRGWGLGLTLAQRIVEDYHGGRIWVQESTPGKGSTLVISFPT
jgi:NtrC-family two-component system sensor histidine kinase KinB